MSLKRFKISKNVTYFDIEEKGMAVEIVGAGSEILDNYNTGEKDTFLVLEFKNLKPLVCKNPVLDALAEAFPEVNEPAQLVGKIVVLVRSEERVAGNMHQLVRIDAIRTIRADAQAQAKREAGSEPKRMKETPPPVDSDAAFGIEPPEDDVPF